MKDILIVVSPSKDENHAVYKEIRKVVSEHKGEIQQILYTSFLLSGPKSFENAMSLARIASGYNFPVAIFEIESCLMYPVDNNLLNS